MSEKFNTRDVSKKEIYDSYMGILRISPNVINGTEIDDATQILNTLYDEDKQQRTQVIVSDSDGNMLPLSFRPRAFEQQVLRRDTKTSIDTNEYTDVINVATIIGDTAGTLGNLYVSNMMKCRSTLYVARPSNDTSIRHSNVRILSGGRSSISTKKITGKGWLLYPTESPNDKNYFNDKNKHGLFDQEDIRPRYMQVEESLYKKTRKWHDSNIDTKERVNVGGKIISQLNQYNEEIPVYYTRDYILGHYDGHQMPTGLANNALADCWGISGESTEGMTDHVTKLSWTRFDKLIWDSLQEVLTGNIRHVSGRYDGMATKESADPGIRKVLGFGESERYKEFAPLLGTEMPRGIVGYHAMPFHRYWFHRTKQALRAFIERRKCDDTLNLLNIPDEFDTLDDYVVSQNLAAFLNTSDEGTKFVDEIEKLQHFYNNDLIAPAPMGTLGFSHSLGKNFLVCNGNTVNFKNFPNISLTNDMIFDTTVKTKDKEGNEIPLTDEYGNLIKGGIANFDTDTKIFKYNDLTQDADSVGYALVKSLGGNAIKLPNLFALYEKTPRFIRGLNWGVKDTNSTVIVHPIANEVIDYVYKSDDLVKIPESNEVAVKNEKHYAITKKITEVAKCYFHTYSHLEEAEQHQHFIFSGTSGATQGTNHTRLYNVMGQNAPHYSGDEKKSWLHHNFTNYDITYSRKNSIYPAHSYNNRYKANTNWITNTPQDNTYMKYCLGPVYTGGLYCNYNPIPNQGLWLFNASIFNNAGNTIGCTTRGTSTFYRPEQKRGNQVVTKELDNDIEGLNSKSKLKNSVFFMDAEGKKHYLKDEAPISVGNQYVTSTSSDKLKQHDEEKQRRKFYAMKMNEAEGFIPITCQGKAQGQILYMYSRAERRKCNAGKRRSHDYSKNNIAGYQAAAKTANPDKSSWRCLTSIAYNNPYKLGVGDIKNYIKNRKDYNENVDYYDVNCVTQLETDAPLKNYQFGGFNVKVDETCPTPTYMNLLPLIRI